MGLVLRYQSYTQQYHARIYCTLCTGGPSTHQYVLELVDYSSGDTVLTSQSVTFDSGDFYTLKASVEDDTLNAKFWKTSETEPVDWDITATNASYTQGKIGIIVSTNTTTFDDVVVNPL